jgi:glycine/D-amino acid oxidase-like deaminating enzyme
VASADVVVIGGGCIGTSTAFQLVRNGSKKVLLIERGSIGSGPTAKSIGIIRLHYTYAPLIKLAARSLDLFRQFHDLTGGTADFSQCGFLLLASAAQMPSVRANVELQRSLGVRTSVVTQEEIRALESCMETDDAGGGAYEPESGFADGYATSASFAAAARRGGAEIWEMARAERILVRGGRVYGAETSRGVVEANAVLVAAGPWTPQLLAPLAVDVPIRASREQVVQLAPPGGAECPKLVCEDMIQGFYERPEAGGTVLAGVLEHEAEEIVPPDEFNHGADFEFIERVGTLWQHRYPELAGAQVRGGYASLYDVTPDWQPVLGAVEGIKGLHVAAGFSGHGFKLSPALGEVLAHVVLGEAPAIDIRMFRLSRFAEGDLIRGRHAQGILG